MQTALNLIQELITWLKIGRLSELASSRHHTPYLTRHRLAAIVTRIRLAAAAFSVLTLIWIMLDAATLERTQWVTLAIFRVGAVMLFIMLAMAPDKDRNRRTVLSLLGSMLAAPMIIYGVFQLEAGGSTLAGLTAINARLYDALPFIVLAGLSIFPLVASEGLMFALPIAATVAAVQMTRTSPDIVNLFSTLWVLMLSLGVYLLACSIQLHYMMALLRRASLDPLTGALTRSSGIEVLDFHFRLACDQETPLAIVFLDLDNFKLINDGFGHEAGDQALRDVAIALNKLMRQADVVIRWGGEEFVLILINTPIEGVRIVMTRILEEWLGKRPDGAPLTASIGVAERQMDAVTDWSSLIYLADERMYQAKTHGKACCVLGDGNIMRSAESLNTALLNDKNNGLI
ncbi:MAG: GGDEF domain-containing protein [Sulfuricella denitrificans]|nr:GGDEF domain-containing protein [Sulfuricella denitrificans]